jgi:hypothetical protein
MTSQVETAVAGISALASSILGSKILPFLANATQSEMPDWMRYLLGPLGALFGMIIAVCWLTKRLDKAEVKADEREDARDIEREKLISVVIENSLVIRDIRSVIEKCKGGGGGC